MIEKTFKIHELPQIANLIFEYINNNSTIALYGDMGSGKTTLSKEIISKFNVEKNSIESPTFVKLYVYEGTLDYKPLNIYHYDLYRIDNDEELYRLGLYDRLGSGLSIIEWAEKMTTVPKGTIIVNMLYIDMETRKISIKIEK